MSTIRPGRPTDLEPLREIQERALGQPWPELLETAVSGPPPLFVLETDKQLGYAIFLAETDDTAYVPELAIHPDHQGLGYGSELVEFLFENLADQGYAALRLTVQATDERARGFYESHGFEELERLDDHYQSGDGVLLTRDLA
jgi:ribosomal-protein-alanine N-acetyltransferase